MAAFLARGEAESLRRRIGQLTERLVVKLAGWQAGGFGSTKSGGILSQAWLWRRAGSLSTVGLPIHHGSVHLPDSPAATFTVVDGLERC